MQTFLPYSDFVQTAKCLDYKRLGKQRVEAMQIYQIITGHAKSKAWTNHPAVNMWRGYADALAKYYNTIRAEWISRGYNNTMPELKTTDKPKLPEWIGDEKFHGSHRGNLKRKDRVYYGKYSWVESETLSYVWPVP